MKLSSKILPLLLKIYSPRDAKHAFEKIREFTNYQKYKKQSASNVNEKDIALITYANSLKLNDIKPLKTLNKFILEFSIYKFINTLHILPFYPWDTDRGFSVVDYREVKPEYGTWNDIKNLSKKQKIMFDFVANHISIDNPIAQESLILRHINIKTKYREFVIAYSNQSLPSQKSLSELSRPRPTSPLTPYFITKSNGKLIAKLGSPSSNEANLGSGFVWTTFSRPKNSDGSESTRQVDLNFKNPNVLIEAIKIIFFYVEMGAKLIRLDAIGYIWKKINSTSLHEKEAHIILQIINSVLKDFHPEITTIAEINEQQDKIVEYLGTSKNPEGDLVYQFTHFPLSIYSLMSENISAYKDWFLSTKRLKGKQFITVLGSHDGLGLKPIRNILPEKEIKKLSDHLVKNFNALPNYAILPGGKKIIYELCSTPWNLINQQNSKESEEIQINRYLVVVCLGLLVKGISAFYINGLLVSNNHTPKSGLDENRTVNREELNYKILKKTLSNNDSIQYKVFNSIKNLLEIRSKYSEFDPLAPFPDIINLKNNSVFGLLVKGQGENDKIISLINVSNKKQKINLKTKAFSANNFTDLISNTKYNDSNLGTLLPYQILWLKQS